MAHNIQILKKNLMLNKIKKKEVQILKNIEFISEFRCKYKKKVSYFQADKS